MIDLNYHHKVLQSYVLPLNYWLLGFYLYNINILHIVIKMGKLYLENVKIVKKFEMFLDYL